MLIFPPTNIRIDRWLSLCARFAIWALSVLSVVLLLFFIFYSSKPEEVALPSGIVQKTGRSIFPYEAIGSGGLALHPRYALGWVSRLADELVLIAYNSRPDVASNDAQILFSLKNGKEQITLCNGHTLYLKESEKGKGLHSTQEISGLWVKPILLENGAVLVEAGRKLVSKEGSIGEEKGQFILTGQEGVMPSCYNPTQQIFAKELKSGRSFPYDLLIQKYGGREYEAWFDKAVLEFYHGSISYACFVSPGDYLQYDAEGWRVIAFEELKGNQPLAYVKTITDKFIDIEAWDETGFCPLLIKIDFERQGKPPLKLEMLPNAIRLRNSHQVSCAFGKRRVLLKQGDWLLKTSTGWRNLRRIEDITQYLHHRLKGELFIFDRIEKEQGRFIMQGHLFDETRTQMQQLTLPIETEKTQGKTTRKRKPLFSNTDRRAA